MSEEKRFGEPEYLGWRLLDRLKEQSDDQISRSKFLKLCCLTDRYLLQNLDYDVGLPRYWYMYGELANEHEFAGRFYNAPNAWGWEGQQYLPKEDLRAEDFDLSEEGFKKIEKAVDIIVVEWGRENVESIKQHQYRDQAPSKFIQKYSELRWQLRNIDFENQARMDNFVNGQTNEDFVRSLLDEMVEAYPQEEYAEMHSLFLRWDDTMRMMLESTPDYGAIEEFLDDFIRTLSRVVLRFEYSQNISEGRLSKWQAEAQTEKAEFERQLREKRKELLLDRGTSPRQQLDAVSDSFSQTVREDLHEIFGDR